MNQRLTKPILLSLNLAAVLWYWLLQHSLLNFRDIGRQLYATGDAQEYREYALWLRGASSYCNPMRTFLYPLVIWLSGGGICLWLLQAAGWLLACNLIFLAIRRQTGNPWLAVAGFILTCANLSLLGLTFHALVEITAFLLLAAMVYLFAQQAERWKEPRVQLWLLGLLAFLAVAKPLYQPLWNLLMLVFLGSTMLRKRRMPWIWLLLAVLPVITQKVISLKSTGSLTSSGIGASDLKKYFYRKTLYLADHGTLDGFNGMNDSLLALQIAKAVNSSAAEEWRFLIAHPFADARVMLADMQENIGDPFPYFYKNKNPWIVAWNTGFNRVMLYIHGIFFLLWIGWLLLHRREHGEGRWRYFLWLGMMLQFIFFSAGLVFWAGDRLVAPATALWVPLYLMLGAAFLRAKTGNKRTPLI